MWDSNYSMYLCMNDDVNGYVVFKQGDILISINKTVIILQYYLFVHVFGYTCFKLTVTGWYIIVTLVRPAQNAHPILLQENLTELTEQWSATNM